MLDIAPRPVVQEPFVPRRVEPQATASTVPSVVACRTCGASNDPNHTYCLSCGSRLPRADSVMPPRQSGIAGPVSVPNPAPLPAAPAPPFGNISEGAILSVASLAGAPAPTSPSPVSPAVIAGTPVHVVTPSPVDPELVRFCPRCHGGSDLAAQFCKFCGGSLADVAPVPVPFASTSESAIAVMPGDPGQVSGATGSSPSVGRISHAPQTTRDVPVAGVADVKFAPEAETRPVNSPPDQAQGGHASPMVDAGGMTATTASTQASSGFLVLVARDGTPAAAYPLTEQMDIGRLEGDVQLPEDPYLSPRHARVVRRDGRHYLRDLGSLNGVYRKLPSGSERDTVGPHVVTLRDGELFLIGQQVLKVELVKDAAETTGLGIALEARDGGTHLFGTPSSPRYARLCQRTVEGVTRDVFYVRKPETVLGRESGDFVFPEDPFLSRRHAIIRASVGAATGGRPTVTLADLGSSNGTFVQIEGEISLSHGDCFRVGHQLFRVEIPTSPRPAS
jgi:pSer/pThr/pTyr-binding forkhead associated (FHA) protein